MKIFSIINYSLTIHQSFTHLIMLYKCFGNISITNIVPCINFTARCEDICVVLMLNCYRVLIYWVQLFVDLKVPFVTAVHCSALICAHTHSTELGLATIPCSALVTAHSLGEHCCTYGYCVVTGDKTYNHFTGKSNQLPSYR